MTPEEKQAYADFRERLVSMSPEEYASDAVRAELRLFQALECDDTPASVNAQNEQSAPARPAGRTTTIRRPLSTPQSAQPTQTPVPPKVVPSKRPVVRATVLYVSLAIVASLLGAGSYWALFRQPEATTAATPELAAVTLKENPAAPTAPTLAEVQAKDPDYSLKPDKVNEVFAGFASWDEERKIDFVSDVMNVQVLPDDLLALFKREIQNKANSHLLRNNMANALMAQKKRDFDLEDLFWRMLNDQTETPTWRDYSIQFYAQCANFSPMPTRIRDNLLTIALADTPTIFGGTAAMMLAYEGNEKVLELPSDFNDRVEKTLLASPDKNLQAAALSIFARRGAKEKLPLLRERMKSEDPLIRRVAVAGVGQLGGREDIEVLRTRTADPDRFVALAAKSALEKLQKTNVLQR